MGKLVSQSYLPIVFLIFLIAPISFTSTFEIHHGAAVAVFCTTVLLWLTELIPLAATALLVPVLAFLFDVLPIDEAFTSFGSSILFLFVGCFLLAQSMQKHGWDKRMAYLILSARVSPKRPAAIIAIIGVICWILSMWVSNTATAAMMTPICLGVIASTKNSFSTPEQSSKFSSRLLLTCAFTASMGGLATPVGSPPNLIAIEFLSNHGIMLSFFDWCLVALPLSLLMLLAVLFLMHLRYPVEDIDMSELKTHFRNELDLLGPVKSEEFQVATVFLLAVLAWVLPGISKTLYPELAITTLLNTKLNMSVVGLAAGLILFVLPATQAEQTNLSWEDAKKIDWGTIMLFGGGLTLGNILNTSGLAVALGNFIFQPEFGLFWLVTLGVIFSILTSEFSSNTASASILVPIMLGSLAGSIYSLEQVTAIVIACVVGASFGFMLPVSTPPNAIVFGTGKLKISEMVVAGSLFDLLGALVTVIFVYAVLL